MSRKLRVLKSIDEVVKGGRYYLRGAREGLNEMLDSMHELGDIEDVDMASCIETIQAEIGELGSERELVVLQRRTVVMSFWECTAKEPIRQKNNIDGGRFVEVE